AGKLPSGRDQLVAAGARGISGIARALALLGDQTFGIAEHAAQRAHARVALELAGLLEEALLERGRERGPVTVVAVAIGLPRERVARREWDDRLDEIAELVADEAGDLVGLGGRQLIGLVEHAEHALALVADRAQRLLLRLLAALRRGEHPHDRIGACDE